MLKVLYIASSQFSGSTLLSFLLNEHPSVATIGHSMGWAYREDEEFRCSCGEVLSDCPLFRLVSQRFSKAGVPFSFREFGTAFRVSKFPRLNRYLVEGIPHLEFNWLERFRDWMVGLTPSAKRDFGRQNQANLLLFRTVLEYLHASVFLDNSHSPYRLRRLGQIPDLEVRNVHLIRDPRGVIFSMMKNSGFGVREAADAWLRRQRDIVRIAAEVGASVPIRYEDLCRDPDATVARVHTLFDLPQCALGTEFKSREHHILGNRMRLGSLTIQPDSRWKTDLAPTDLKYLEHRLADAISRGEDGLVQILEPYRMPA